jgi:hypothetical protein
VSETAFINFKFEPRGQKQFSQARPYFQINVDDNLEESSPSTTLSADKQLALKSLF